MPRIFNKASFDLKISRFFENYLVGQKTQYVWNSFSFSLFNIDIGVGQGSALFLIWSALYISLVLYIFEKCLKILKILIFFPSFIDNGLLIAQNKSFSTSNSLLFCSYQIISSLLDRFGLKLEYGKTKVFYFSRSNILFNPSLLDLSPFDSPVLWPKNLWKYLGFIFNKKLSFCTHINFYANKVVSTVKSIKFLDNSSHSLIPQQKCLLYRSCILSIVLYRY